jgi:hypothetical protein
MVVFPVGGSGVRISHLFQSIFRALKGVVLVTAFLMKSFAASRAAEVVIIFIEYNDYLSLS